MPVLISSRFVDRILIILVSIGAFAAGLAFVFVVPPMGGVDEPFHWKRAVQVSQGTLFAPTLGPNNWGGPIRAGAVDMTEWYMDHFPRHQPVDLQESRRKVGEFSAQQGDRSTGFPSTASFAALAYLPQAAGILTARIAGGDLLAQFHAGRIANLLVYVILVATAAWVMPFAGLAVMALMINPHAIHLAASHNADPLNFTIPLLLVAWCLRLRFDDAAPFGGAVRRGIAALTLSFGLLKLTTFLFSPLLMTIPLRRFGSARARLLFVAALVTGSAAIAIVWNSFYPFVPGPYWTSGGDPAAAIAAARSKPAETALLFFTTVRDYGFWYWLDGYSRFGAHPGPFHFFIASAVPAYAALAGLVALAMADGSRQPDRRLGSLYVAVALVYAAAVLVAFYVGFSPPGADHIIGPQGRYFMLPWLLCVVAVALATPWRTWLAPLRIPLLLGILALHVVVTSEAIDRYRTTTWTAQQR